MDMGIGLNITAATFGCESIFQYGTEEQKQTYLPPVCSGEKVSPGPSRSPTPGPMSPDTRPGPSRTGATT